jgi:hypothetical protein
MVSGQSIYSHHGTVAAHPLGKFQRGKTATGTYVENIDAVPQNNAFEKMQSGWGRPERQLVINVGESGVFVMSKRGNVWEQESKRK